MKRKSAHSAVRLAALAAVLVAAAASARVFQRWGAQAARGVTADDFGWRSLYNTTLSLNGGEGELEVMGCDQDFETALAKIKEGYRAEGAVEFTSAGKTLAWAIVVWKGQVVRILVTALGRVYPFLPAWRDEGGQCVVFRLVQAPAEFRRSLRPPARHMIEAVPAYPGSTPAYFLQDRKTKMAVEIASCTSYPGAIAGFLDSALTKRGWTTPVTAAVRSAAGLGVYVKGAEVCCVAVGQSAASGQTLITVLHKRLGVGEGAGR
ncbi:MAG: hypothetical protein JXR37_03130 [Kiritimatiellae bacterium]|nr:hypothetical protein [Kiritimatiellia bacterium]